MLIFLLFYVFIMPIFLILHEIGHGLGVILTSKSNASIYLGDFDKHNKRNFSIGRLHFHIHWSHIGYCSWDSNLNKRQRICALAGGPIMSLLLVCIFLLIKQEVSQEIIRSIINGIIFSNFITFLLSVIPISYPRWLGPLSGNPSDGLQLLRLFRS